MSTTTTPGIDARAYLSGFLQALCGMTTADIKAIPDDKWSESMGGCSNGCNNMIGDTVTNLLWTAAALRGEESDAYNHMGAVAEKCRNKDAAIAALNEAAAEFNKALAGASDEHLNSTVKAPWGMDTPIFTLAHISVSHVWYHDGQLNYVQTLLGDKDVHWMAG